LQTWTRPYW